MDLGSLLMIFVIKPLELLFEVIYSVSYRLILDPGLSIVVLSLAINLLVLPLYKRADAMQEEARQKEASLKPWVQHIRRTFKGDERTMMLQAYYRQNNYSPTHVLRGAVSLLLQIPFFMAAYRFLSGLTLLEGVVFGPIRDLSLPDGLLKLGSLSINLLPILMTAINGVSSAIYTKGFPLKDKLQLYGMALVFLVLLYDSPSGLVFYWTLNNLFSLVKTIVYKVRDKAKAKKALKETAVQAGVPTKVLSKADAEKLARARAKQEKRAAKAARKAEISRAKQEIRAAKAARKGRKSADVPAAGNAAAAQKSRKGVFLLGALLLSVLTGALIPSAVIKASPQEFVDPNLFFHPLRYVLQSLLLALGTFLLWVGVFYRLAAPKGKAFFEAAVWILSGTAVADYLFFATDTGILSSDLVFEEAMSFSLSQILINSAVILLIVGGFLLLFLKLKQCLKPVLTVALLAFACMAVMNCVQIRKDISRLTPENASAEAEAPYFTLSRGGKNVVVIMLDRAMGELVPAIMQEKPALKKQFDGFTYYANTVSFGAYTNFAAPALFGGYEYTPYAMNLRKDLPLKAKHNEALRLMPSLFRQADYDVTVFDPTYANYEWIPDLSVFADLEGVRCFNTNGFFDELSSREGRIAARCRNFFCYSLMKTSPLLLQNFFYNDGQYNTCSIDIPTGQYYSSPSRANGLTGGFLQAFNVLKNMGGMTRLTDDPAGSFLMMSNDATHEVTLLREPDYVPAAKVDNTDYDSDSSRFTAGGRTLKVESYTQFAHYQSNMAALLQLGSWFDELREMGVYDNTRIILASDHGRDLHLLDEEMLFREDDEADSSLEFFLPLLMVKDFGAKGFTVSDSFMTNADVPTLAFRDLIRDPVNPATGKPVDSAEKTAHPQYVFASQLWSVSSNNGSRFRAGRWYSVHDNVWDRDNWTLVKENAVMPD